MKPFFCVQDFSRYGRLVDAYFKLCKNYDLQHPARLCEHIIRWSKDAAVHNKLVINFDHICQYAMISLYWVQGPDFGGFQMLPRCVIKICTE